MSGRRVFCSKFRGGGGGTRLEDGQGKMSWENSFWLEAAKTEIYILCSHLDHIFLMAPCRPSLLVVVLVSVSGLLYSPCHIAKRPVDFLITRLFLGQLDE